MVTILEGYLEDMEDIPCNFGEISTDDFWEIIARNEITNKKEIENDTENNNKRE